MQRNNNEVCQPQLKMPKPSTKLVEKETPKGVSKADEASLLPTMMTILATICGGWRTKADVSETDISPMYVCLKGKLVSDPWDFHDECTCHSCDYYHDRFPVLERMYTQYHAREDECLVTNASMLFGNSFWCPEHFKPTDHIPAAKMGTIATKLPSLPPADLELACISNQLTDLLGNPAPLHKPKVNPHKDVSESGVVWGISDLADFRKHHHDVSHLDGHDVSTPPKGWNLVVVSFFFHDDFTKQLYVGLNKYEEEIYERMNAVYIYDCLAVRNESDGKIYTYTKGFIDQRKAKKSPTDSGSSSPAVAVGGVSSAEAAVAPPVAAVGGATSPPSPPALVAKGGNGTTA